MNANRTLNVILGVYVALIFAFVFATITTPSGDFTVPTNDVQLTQGHDASFVISADLVHISLAKPDGGNIAR